MIPILLFLGFLAAPADLTVAQEFVNTASQHFQRGAYQDALDSLRKAEPIAAQAHHPSLAPIRFNIARCLDELGRKAEALDAYASYLKLPDEGHRKQRAVAAIKELKRALFGGLSVSCDPSGASVKYTGPKEGTRVCPFQVSELSPGTYQVVVEFAGYERFTKSVEVVAGQVMPVTARLTKIVSEAPPPVVDNKPASPTKVWPWVTMGIGAAALAGGAVLTLKGIDERDAAEGLSPGDERDDKVSSYEQSELFSWIGYGVGAAAIVGSVLWLSLDDGRSEPSSWHFTGSGVWIQW